MKTIIDEEFLAEEENPEFEHGEYVTCEIGDRVISDARLSIDSAGDVFICQNTKDGSQSDNMLGYRYSWFLDYHVTDLRHVQPSRNTSTSPHCPTTPVTQHVIFNGPATVVFWPDGDKTVTKCSKDDEFDPKMGFLMAYFRKHSGLTKTQTAKFLKRICDVMEAKNENE
jgi:hypothetical protein